MARARDELTESADAGPHLSGAAARRRPSDGVRRQTGARRARRAAAAALFGLGILTDWLDGYLARRRHQVTWFGQILDPIADKLLISATLVSLVQLNLAPAWMVAVIIGREFAVTGLRSLAHARGLSMPASRSGKLKMASQVVAILLADSRMGTAADADAGGAGGVVGGARRGDVARPWTTTGASTTR